MDLQRAYETLGLTRDAPLEAVEAAYDHLSAECQTRAAQASTSSIRRRYLEALGDLEGARDVVRSSLALRRAGAESDDALAIAHAVLGLRSSSTPVDVASAYVTLCEELDRDLDTVPTEAMRRRCMEARAEVDEAYRYCIASAQPAADSNSGNEASYETQMATEPFEGAAAEPREVMIVASEPSPRELREQAAQQNPRRRGGRPIARFVATAAGVVALAGITLAGFSVATDTDLMAAVRRLLPDEEDPRITQAHGDAELARHRIAQERQELQVRADDALERVLGLERELGAAESADERDRLRAELGRARSRHALAVDLGRFADQYVFEGSDLAIAYGRIELGQELAQAKHKNRALRAFQEAESLIEAALTRVDQAEQALGARSEAVAAKDAWQELQSRAALPDSVAADEGDVVLSDALGLLSDGAFDEASTKLERAAQLFRIALDDGRRRVADGSAAAPAAAAEALPADPRPDPVASAIDSPLPDVTAQRPDVTVLRQIEEPVPEPERPLVVPPPVSAPPPRAPTQRAAIKLVAVPGGAFLEPCSDGGTGECANAQARGELALPAFRIDRTEVRVDEYAACVNAGMCPAPGTSAGCNWQMQGRGDHPINCVDWEQAHTYCGWVGKRLPSEREWEKAARGQDGRAFPWGDSEPTCGRAVIGGSEGLGCGRDSTWPVASLDAGRSPYGLFDMAGNVMEWTADRVGNRAVVRGGSWRSEFSPGSWRDFRQAAARDGALGFRCAGAGQLADAR